MSTASTGPVIEWRQLSGEAFEARFCADFVALINGNVLPGASVRWQFRFGMQGIDKGESETLDAARTACEAAIRDWFKRAGWPSTEWTDADQPLPEDGAIKAAHPLKTGKHDTYAEALRLVGAKRSKYALVDLVNYLLVQISAHEDTIWDQRDATRVAPSLSPQAEGGEASAWDAIHQRLTAIIDSQLALKSEIAPLLAENAMLRFERDEAKENMLAAARTETKCRDWLAAERDTQRAARDRAEATVSRLRSALEPFIRSIYDHEAFKAEILKGKDWARLIECFRDGRDALAALASKEPHG